jgi:hypothetical protein
MTSTLRIATFAAGIAFALPLVSPAAPPDSAPLVLPKTTCKVKVASVTFMTKVNGVDGNHITPKDPTKYRVAFVTVRIDKPAGYEVTVAACDLSLHYRHGAEVEATICEGISSFSLGENDDRPMKLPKSDGPGFVKQTTGPKTAIAETVYFDAVFAGIEPDTSDVWLCIAQPVSTAPVATTGWTP